MMLIGIPIPPTFNHSYPTGKNGRRFKSQELKDWESQFRKWSHSCSDAIKEARKDIADINCPRFLCVTIIYHYHHYSVLTQRGTSRKNDIDNRLKHVLDQVAKLLGFDDSEVWDLHARKKITSEKMEYVSFEFESIINPYLSDLATISAAALEDCQ